MNEQNQAEESQESPFLDPTSCGIIFNQLGSMIDDVFEKEYTAIVKFKGEKLSRGFHISKLEIKKSVNL